MKTLLLTSAFVVLPCPADAEYGRTPLNSVDPEILKIDEEAFLGTPLDGDYLLVDGEGREFRLKELFGKPVILVLSYYACDGSCPTINMQLREITGKIARLKPGTDYNVLTLSFDKNDGAESIKMFEEMVGLGADEQGWRTAVFKDKEKVQGFTDSVGFKYFWSGRDRLFFHPSVVIFLTPEGRVARYLYGASMDELDVELAVTETGFGQIKQSKIKDLTDLLLIACYSYNFKEGKYALNYPLFIALGSLITGVTLIFGSIVLFKNKARR